MVLDERESRAWLTGFTETPLAVAIERTLRHG